MYSVTFHLWIRLKRYSEKHDYEEEQAEVTRKQQLTNTRRFSITEIYELKQFSGLSYRSCVNYAQQTWNHSYLTATSVWSESV